MDQGRGLLAGSATVAAIALAQNGDTLALRFDSGSQRVSGFGDAGVATYALNAGTLRAAILQDDAALLVFVDSAGKLSLPRVWL